jgi:hypothetical protein
MFGEGSENYCGLRFRLGDIFALGLFLCYTVGDGLVEYIYMI